MMAYAFNSNGLTGLREHHIAAVVKVVSRHVGHTTDKNVSVALLPDDKMRALNKTYRQKDTTPNVLSFPSHDKNHPDFLGEVLIAVPHARREAEKLGEESVAYMQFLVVHGLLHLSGYDHMDGDSAEMMESLEHKIITELASL